MEVFITTATLLELRTAARQRADQVNSAFVDDTELSRFVNAAAKELYDILIKAYGNDYFIQKRSVTIDGADTAQVTTFGCPAGNATGLHGTWFRIHSAENLTKYAFIFQVDAAAITTAPLGLTVVTVSVASTDTATQLASKLATALATVADFTATPSTSNVACTNTATGICQDATNQGVVPSLTITITTQGHEKDRYRLPSDFYKVTGINGQINGGDPFSLRPIDFSQRNIYRNALLTGVSAPRRPMKYCLNDSNIILMPVPSVMTLTYWYIPLLAKLQNDTDPLEGINGWEEYVVVRAARHMIAKEESDTTDLDNELSLLTTRIIESAEDREADIGHQVIDVQRDYYSDNFGFHGDFGDGGY